MNLKKKLKRFFTLRRRADDGFTLVELIVVIAIMAILAGVGSVGYAGYIKSSNKNADKVLVGNIMRAIETGTYSYTVELSEAIQVSEQGTKMPVGFIVLTQEGGTTKESATVKAAITSKNNCVIEKMHLFERVKTGTDKWKDDCDKEQTRSVYTVTDLGEFEVCTAHSQFSAEDTYVWGTGVSSDNASSEDSVKYNDDSHRLKTGSNIATPETGHVHGQKVSFDTYQPDPGNFTTITDGALYDALVMAFGENPDLRLKYDGWTNSSIPSFWGSAATTWKNVKRLADMMYSFAKEDNIASAMGVGQYDSSAQIVYTVSNAVKESFADKNAFVTQWETYGDYAETDEKHGGDEFGIDRTKYEGREFYSAMRASYNNCVSTYIKQHHSTTAPYSPEIVNEHVASLASYGESAGELVKDKLGGGFLGNVAGGFIGTLAGENLPRQLCKASFTTEEGKSYLGDAKDCAECQRLYSEYVDSGSDVTDAAAVYDTLLAAADADPTLLQQGAIDGSDRNSTAFFDYYEKQLQEYEGMYSAVKAEIADGKSAIVIQIYYENGVLSCDVSPFDANPRND